MGFLPDYILGAPTIPFFVCTIAPGIIAVGVMGEADNPITFAGCAVAGWIIAILFRGLGYMFQSVNWESLASSVVVIVLWIIGIAVAAGLFVLLFNLGMDAYDRWQGIHGGQLPNVVSQPKPAAPQTGMVQIYP